MASLRGEEKEDEDGAELTEAEKRLAAIRKRMVQRKREAQRAVHREEKAGGSSAAAVEDEGARFSSHNEKKRKAMAEAGIPEDKMYMVEGVEEAERKAEKERRKKKNMAMSFGWEVFNSDARYRSYKKQLVALPKAATADELAHDELVREVVVAPALKDLEAAYGQNDFADKEGVDRLVKQMEVQEEKHKKWSRHRTANPDATVDYINDRNRRFNEKVARAYDKYTVEIRQNLERGTAL